MKKNLLVQGIWDEILPRYVGTIIKPYQGSLLNSQYPRFRQKALKAQGLPVVFGAMHGLEHSTETSRNMR